MLIFPMPLYLVGTDGRNTWGFLHQCSFKNALMSIPLLPKYLATSASSWLKLLWKKHSSKSSMFTLKQWGFLQPEEATTGVIQHPSCWKTETKRNLTICNLLLRFVLSKNIMVKSQWKGYSRARLYTTITSKNIHRKISDVSNRSNVWLQRRIGEWE